MEIDTCPRCGSRHLRGQVCSCQLGRPAVSPLVAGPRAPAPVPPPARPRPSTPTYRVVLFTILGLLVLGIIGGTIAGRTLDTGAASESRQGDTSVEYPRLLTDEESAQALLALIQSSPGYDLYTVFYPDSLGGLMSLSYQFSTDTVAYYFVLGDKPQLLTWHGHGLDRLSREAAGTGTLDD